MSTTPIPNLYYSTRYVQEGSLPNLLSSIDYQFKISPWEGQQEGFFYIDVNHNFLKYNNFDYIEKHIIKIGTKTNMKIIIWHPFEAYVYDYQADNWNKLIKICLDNNINLNRLYFVSGDQKNIETKNKDYNMINRIGFDLFEAITYFRYIQNCPWQAGNTNKDKLFLNLNGRPRSHRVALYYYLKVNNLFDNSLISFNPDSLRIPPACWEPYMPTPEEFDESIKFKKVILDKDIKKYAGYQNKEWYDRTVFSLVTETFDFNYNLFPTEKIYKPLMLGHPFVVFGNPGLLDYLRKQGYQTFSEMFDESYDSIDCNLTRLQKIIDICKSTPIKNWSEETVEKVNYNRSLFYKQHNSQKSFRNVVDSIFTT